MKQLIEQATEFLKGKIRSTPVEFSPELSKLLGHVRPKGPTVIVLTGRNVSYSTLRQVIGGKR